MAPQIAEEAYYGDGSCPSHRIRPVQTTRWRSFTVSAVHGVSFGTFLNGRGTTKWDTGCAHYSQTPSPREQTRTQLSLAADTQGDAALCSNETNDDAYSSPE